MTPRSRAEFPREVPKIIRNETEEGFFDCAADVPQERDEHRCPTASLRMTRKQ
jgi:hypothetical protein